MLPCCPIVGAIKHAFDVVGGETIQKPPDRLRSIRSSIFSRAPLRGSVPWGAEHLRRLIPIVYAIARPKNSSALYNIELTFACFFGGHTEPSKPRSGLLAIGGWRLDATR